MKYSVVNGDIFTTNCNFIVNPVNCVGVMGAGLALEFKNRYPEMFKLYRSLCKNNILILGNPYICDRNAIHADHDIILFPTKMHWKEQSKLSYIKAGLEQLLCYFNLFFEYEMKTQEISIAFPLLGCGLGGLNRDEVLATMETMLTSDDATSVIDEVVIYV